MLFTEEYLFEVTFTNPNNLKKHYLSHVLQPGEQFNPEDPKFPYMTMEEYAQRAQELSEEPAGLSTDRNSHVIGFKVENDRLEKFRKRSPFYPDQRFSEVVVYVDDDKKGHEIISYMIGRPGKLFRELKKYTGELPENEDKQQSLSELFELMKNF